MKEVEVLHKDDMRKRGYCSGLFLVVLSYTALCFLKQILATKKHFCTALLSGFNKESIVRLLIIRAAVTLACESKIKRELKGGGDLGG